MERNDDPTAATVAANLKRLRAGRSWSVRELADRLTQAGRTFSHSAVTRTENGTRQASVGDLMSFAAVFDVSPLAFLLPMADKEEEVAVTGLGDVPAGPLWEWASGGMPLEAARTGYTTDAALWRYQTEGLPVFRREWPHPEEFRRKFEGGGE
ncbi:helix-turn-helix domain-containing protein [Streptomyces sp. NPDC126933]|uniref:helix-turn-helix domain-containing protein n=1 Tax=unclassified Streptomyces TaxID=2593676 RepID=UPI00364F36AB